MLKENKQNIINVIEGKPLYKVAKIEDLKNMINYCRTRYSDNIAFRFRKTPDSEIEYKTYNQFARDINSFGSALIKMGFKDNRIAIIGENRYEWIVSYLAAVNGAGIAIPLDRMLPPNEIEAMLERADADVIVYSDDFQSVMEDISRRNKKLKAYICMNQSSEEQLNKTGFHSFYEILKYGEDLINNGFNEYINLKINPLSMRILLFTSGTSSQSKAVMLCHKNICADIMGLGGIVYCKPGESVLSILPLHHTFENTVGLLFPLYLGMTISICDGLKYINKNLDEYKPDLLVGVPLIYDKFKNRMINELKKRKLYRKVKLLMKLFNILSYLGLDFRRKIFRQLLEPLGGRLRVIVTGGAAMDPDTAQWFENIGVKVYQGYGLTETSPVVAGGNDRRRKKGTCGEPLPGVKIGIAVNDKKGPGEIVVKGDTVMLGYWNNEEATREAIRDGWFYTGDLGYIDKKGLLHVTGRAKSMIVLKNGKKVFPEELENYINQLGFVKESLVWGEITKKGTVEICTKIILDKDKISSMVKSPDDEKGIRKLLDQAIKDINKLVPVYKAIRYYVFGYEELIKTTSMKIKRYVETAQIREILNNMATNIKDLAGKNIDKLKEMMAKGIQEY
ncbi:MAG: AMP-binding protein [Clostridiaceae bacterium]|nr:AMP-binding protein [Clostridiaceae bacterium]